MKESFYIWRRAVFRFLPATAFRLFAKTTEAFLHLIRLSNFQINLVSFQESSSLDTLFDELKESGRVLVDVLAAACLGVNKLALAAAVFVDGDFESAGPLGVGDDFVVELSW